MPSQNQGRQTEEKLDSIASRVAAVRRRINSLAVQHVVFCSLAGIVGAGAAIYLGAFALAPIAFLICAMFLALCATAIVASAMRDGWRMRAGALRAAEVADQRGGLKDRLATVMSASEHVRDGAMWEYLIEDTLGRAQEYEPRKIEPRRISRSIYALAATLLFAALAFPLGKLAARHAAHPAAPSEQDDLTLNLDDLNLRPAEPGDDDGGLSVSADPATMRKLEAKLAREGIDGNGDDATTSLGRLMNQARNMAGNLQGKLTGRPAQDRKVNLKLAESGDDLEHRKNNQAIPPLHHRRHRDVAGQFKSEHAGGQDIDRLPRDARIPNTPAQSMGGGDESASGEGKPLEKSEPDERSPENSDSDDGADLAANGGANHGIGADPDSLFGSQADAKLGTEGFEISIEARPMEHGAHNAGHAYEPPRVRTPLSGGQKPDQPVARAEVPPEDRATIKKVYER